METITSITSFVDKNGKDKLVINNKHFISSAWMSKQTGIKTQFTILIGCDISVEYFIEGETIGDGKLCTKNNTIIAGFTVVLSPRLQAFKDAAAFGTVLQVIA